MAQSPGVHNSALLPKTLNEQKWIKQMASTEMRRKGNKRIKKVKSAYVLVLMGMQ